MLYINQTKQENKRPRIAASLAIIATHDGTFVSFSRKETIEQDIRRSKFFHSKRQLTFSFENN